MYVDPVIATAVGTIVSSMAGFIIYLIKYVLADKDKQIKELAEDNQEWQDVALTALQATRPLAEVVADSNTDTGLKPRTPRGGGPR